MASETPPVTTTPTRATAWWRGPWPAVLLGCACYFNSLPNELVYDDESQVTYKTRIRSLTRFRDLWLTDYNKSDAPELARWQADRDLLYRPLTDFTLAVNYALHGPPAWGFRLGNVLLHGLTCLLVWHFTRRLLADATLASCTAFLFAVHPVHCEAVVYIVGRAELSVAVLLLLGLLILLPRGGPPNYRRTLLAAPLFFAALLSKESAVCYFPAALLVLHATPHHGARRRLGWWLAHAAILLLPIALYLPLRFIALEHHLTRTMYSSLLNPLVGADVIQRIVGAFTVLGHYARLFLLPLRLSVDYGLAVIDPRTGPNAMTWLGIAAALGLSVGVAGYTRASATWRRVALLCALWIAGYFLVSNTLVLIGTAVAERLMYWPSVPVCMLLALAARGAWRRAASHRRDARGPRLVGAAAGLLILAALAGRTLARNIDWATGLRLFTTDAATFPHSAQINGNAAIDYLRRALRSADATARRQALEQADRYVSRALQVYPDHFAFLSTRSEILAALGDVEPALELAKRALALNPSDAGTHANVGRLLQERGRYADAVPYLEQAVRLVPDELSWQMLLARALDGAGQTQRAIEVLQRVAARDRTNWQARRVLADLLLPRNPNLALPYAREAYALHSDDLRVQLVLAEALLAGGERREGLELFRKIYAGLPAGHPLRGQIEQRLASASQRPATQPSDPP